MSHRSDRANPISIRNLVALFLGLCIALLPKSGGATALRRDYMKRMPEIVANQKPAMAISPVQSSGSTPDLPPEQRFADQAHRSVARWEMARESNGLVRPALAIASPDSGLQKVRQEILFRHLRPEDLHQLRRPWISVGRPLLGALALNLFHMRHGTNKVPTPYETLSRADLLALNQFVLTLPFLVAVETEKVGDRTKHIEMAYEAGTPIIVRYPSDADPVYEGGNIESYSDTIVADDALLTTDIDMRMAHPYVVKGIDQQLGQLLDNLQ